MEYYIELASQNGNSYIVNTLLKSGADIKAKQAALIRATYNNRIEIVQLLIEYKTDVNVKDTNSNTPLHIATQRNHHELMDILMQNGADIEATDRKGFSPIHLALGFKKYQALEVLIKYCANVNARSPEGSTPLHTAVSQGFEDGVQLLVNNGVEVDANDNYGHTPLHYAIMGKISKKKQDPQDTFIKIAEILLENEANIEAKINGLTPLTCAALQNEKAILKLLLAYGAKTEIKANDRFTALHFAVSRNYLKVVKILIKGGANIRARNAHDQTPLF